MPLYCRFVVSSRSDVSPWATIGFAAIASLLLHLVLWPVGNTILRTHFGGGPLPASSGAMEVSLLPIEEPPPEREPDEPDPKRDPAERLVKLDALEREARPEDADYVSEFDHRVETQQRAPKARPQPGPAPTAASAARPASSAQPRGLALRPGREQADGEGDGEQSLEDDVRGTEALRGAGPVGAQLDPRAVPGLSERLRQQWGSPGTLDPIDDEIEEGEGNILNTRRFLYASFFNRLRDQVAEHWEPEAAQTRHDPSGSVAGRGPRRTVLAISLNPDGTLYKIRVQEPSGLAFLDEEAIRAVRAASPFSNPPPQLVDAQTRHIDFLFGFILDVGGSKRIFRYRR